MSSLVAAYSAVVFLVTYYLNPSRPGITFPLGWYQAWADQTAYYSMLSGIPHGNLGTFRFPPGYPFLGYLGSLIWPYDPFLPVDLALFVAFIWLSWQVFRVFLPDTVALVGVAVLVHISVMLFVEPWTSSVSAAGVALIIYVSLYKKCTLPWAFASGITLAVIFGSRPQDAAIAALVFLLGLPRSQWGVRWLTAVAVPIAVIVPLVLWVNHHFSHHWLGTYFETNVSQGFDWLHAPRKLYGYFLDPWKYDHQTGRPVIQVLPFLLLAPFGLAWLAAKPPRRVAMLYGAALASWFAVYSAFYAINGATLQYGSIHYVKLLFPAFLGCGLYALLNVPEHRRGGGISHDDSSVRGQWD